MHFGVDVFSGSSAAVLRELCVKILKPESRRVWRNSAEITEAV
jgi:hypothetical protein